MTSPRRTRVPSYRHFKPRDLAVVTIKGRDVYLGRYGSRESREKYARLIAEYLATGIAPASPQGQGRGADDAPVGVTIAELISAFERHCREYYRLPDGRLSSQYGLIGSACRPLRESHGSTLARDFGPLALKALRERWVRAGLSRSGVNRNSQLVKSLFRWGTENELVPPSVHQALSAVAGLRKGRTDAPERPPVKPVPETIVEATLPFLSATIQAMVRVQALTGMRPGEVCTMRTRDLNTTGKVWEYRPDHHKTEHHGKARVIMIGPQAQEILRPWLRTALDEFLFSPAEAEDARLVALRATRKTRVQPCQQNRRKRRPRHQPGARYTAGSYALAVGRACDRAFPHPDRPVQQEGEKLHGFARRRKAWDEAHAAELKAWRRDHHWHPNQLRHLAATNLRREFGLDVARTVLGHSSPAVTLIYAEADLAKAAEAMSKVG